MLTFVMSDVCGDQVILPPPLSVTLRMEEDVPADDLYAVFPMTDCAELCGIQVYDGSRLIFVGVVDEEERLYRESGAYLRISARSLAAHLLDNEAAPCCYDHPNARLILERHVSGYGLTAGDPDDATCLGELTVTKGMSQWSVIRDFCAACYSSAPWVSADGVLYLKGLPRRETVVFGAGGLGYTELTDCRRRYEEISRVNIKISAAEGYSHPIADRDALCRGIRRERYVNAMLDGAAIRSADLMIENGRQKAHTLTLRCPGRHLDLPGCGAIMCDAKIGGDGDYYVSAVKYRMDSRGETTEVKLRRRIQSCG